MTAWLPNAAHPSVADSEIPTTLCYRPRWLADAGANGTRMSRRRARARAYQIRDRRAGSFRITELEAFAQFRGLNNRQPMLFHRRRLPLIYTYSNYAEIHQ